MKLSNAQKLIILLIALLAIVLAVVFFVLNANNKSKKTTNRNTSTNTQNTNQTPVTATAPPIEISKNYNQVVKDVGAKVTAGTVTSSDYISLGVAYYNLGNLAKSLDAYKQATVKDPKNSSAYGNMGNIYRDQGEFDKAVQSYKTAIQLDPKNATFYISLAFLYSGLMSDQQSAINILNQGLTAIPNDPNITKLLADYSK
jgi:cytochrome c-type biogenesis protein CcmH/NrfG